MENKKTPIIVATLISFFLFFDKLQENLPLYLSMYFVFFIVVLIDKYRSRHYFVLLIMFSLVTFSREPIVDSLIAVFMPIVCFISLFFYLIKHTSPPLGWEDFLFVMINIVFVSYLVLFQISDSKHLQKDIEKRIESHEIECNKGYCAKQVFSHGITSVHVTITKKENCFYVEPYFTIIGFKKNVFCKE